jgi:hypothetical protein
MTIFGEVGIKQKQRSLYLKNHPGEDPYYQLNFGDFQIPGL